MYAVIKTGGKQHKVQTGDVIEVEKIVHEGETITFHPLLVVDDDGATHVGAEAAKASVTAKPLGEKKGDKVKIFKYRPKSGYARRQGHRQVLTMLEITGVSLDGKAPAKASGAEKKTEPAKKTTPAKTTTAKKTTAKKTTAKKTTATKAKAGDAAE